MSKQSQLPFQHNKSNNKLPSEFHLQSVTKSKRKSYLGENIMLLPTGTVGLLSLEQLEQAIDELVNKGMA